MEWTSGNGSAGWVDEVLTVQVELLGGREAMWRVCHVCVAMVMDWLDEFLKVQFQEHDHREVLENSCVLPKVTGATRLVGRRTECPGCGVEWGDSAASTRPGEGAGSSTVKGQGGGEVETAAFATKHWNSLRVRARSSREDSDMVQVEVDKRWVEWKEQSNWPSVLECRGHAQKQGMSRTATIPSPGGVVSWIWR